MLDPETVTEYVEYMAKAGDSFDLLALKMYGDDKLAGYISDYNPDFADVILFEGGEKLMIPVVNNPETEDTIAPWRR